MSETLHFAKLHVPVARMAAVVLLATAGVGLVCAGIGWMITGAAPVAPAIGLGAALVGAAVGVLPWIVLGDRPAITLALMQVVASAIRIVVSAGIAVGLALALDVDRGWVLGVFLASGLASLGAEVYVLTPIVASAKAETTTPEQATEPAG